MKKEVLTEEEIRAMEEMDNIFKEQARKSKFKNFMIYSFAFLSLLIYSIGVLKFGKYLIATNVKEGFWKLVFLNTVLYASIPLSAVGFHRVATLLYEFWRMSQGYYKVKFRYPNHVIKEVMLKPKGNIIEWGGKTFEFDKKPSNVYFTSWFIPTIEYDIVTSKQLDFRGNVSQTKIDPENLNAMHFRIYNLGKKEGLRHLKYMLYGFVGLGLLDLITLITILQRLPAK